MGLPISIHACALFAATFQVVACDAAQSAPGDAATADDAALSSLCESGPLAEPIAGCRPTTMASTGNDAQDCVNRINQFRAQCQCLPPLARWTDGEACASQMAEHDSETGTAHSGAMVNLCDWGFGQNECPGWDSTSHVVSGCLQAMWDEGPGEPFSEHGHYINMSSTRFSKVACGVFTTTSGDVWAVQNFR